MMKKITGAESPKSELLIYQATDGKIKLDVLLEEETVWLTIDQMGELFQKSRSTINEHILNIYEEGELAREGSLRKIGNSDFSAKPTNYYNLDVIISVGYRVKSKQGTQFRIWATQRLKYCLFCGQVAWPKWTEWWRGAVGNRSGEPGVWLKKPLFLNMVATGN